MYAKFQRQPKIEVTYLDDERICFILSGTDVSVANALRRIMLAEVPTLAIELVTMEENTSVHQDELIAHRLGFIPIDSRKIKKYVNKADCTCADRCNRCAAVYQLDVQCSSSEGMTITHHDITRTANAPDLMPLPEYSPESSRPNNGIIIGKLRLNQRIKAELVAVKGIGKVHAKWVPAATAVFRYEPVITINQETKNSVPLEVKKKIVESCPRQVYQMKASAERAAAEAFDDNLFGASVQDTECGDIMDIEVADKMRCIFCQECTNACRELGYKDFVKVSYLPEKFFFSVESAGTLNPEQIVEFAFDVLEEKLSANLNALTVIPGGGAAAGGSVARPDEAAAPGGGAYDLSL